MWDWKGLTSSECEDYKAGNIYCFLKNFHAFQTNGGTFTAFWIMFFWGADLDGIATKQLRNDPFFSLLVQWDFLSGKLCWIIATKWFAKLTGILFSFSRFMSNPIQPEYLPIISKIWFQCYPIFIEFRTFISIFFFSKLSNIMSVGLDGWNYESRMGVWYVFLINHFHWLCALIEISKHNNLFPPRMFFS